MATAGRKAKESKCDFSKTKNRLLSGKDMARQYLDIAGVIIVVIDHEGKVSLINKKGCKLLGYPEKEIVGKRWVEKFVPARLRKQVNSVLTKVLTGETKPVEHFENPIVTKAGEERLINWYNTTVKDKNGCVICTLSSGEDITERKKAENALKESEERFRRLVESSHDLIMLTREDGTIAYLSPACSKVLGHNPKALLNTRPSIFHPEDDKMVQTALRGALVGKRGANLEYRVLTKDGKVKWISHSWSPVMLSGKLHMVASVVRDITERKKAQEKLIYQKEQIERLSKTKERFMADMTHELKTPISVIMLNLEMAKRMDPTAQRGELNDCFELMWRNSIRLNRSVEQIMQVMKAESTDLTISRFRLIHLISRVCEEYLPLAKMKGIDFQINGPDIEMEGNQHLLAMAVSNLVSNSVKFTYGGSVRVTWLETRRNAIITVSDTGIGIKPENSRKVFSKFFKEDHDAPGSGIGLAISADIITRMGGRIDFESVPGKGSTFRIVVPKEARR